MAVERKAPMVLGIGAVLAGLLLIFKKKRPELPEAPPNGVVVALLNPPSGANKWQIRIIDDVGLKTMVWGVDDHGNIEKAAVFELSPDWLFPLMVDIRVYQEWQEDGEWSARQLYYVQSHRPIKPFTIDEEDPNYREVFIPDYGSYYYNVSQERFE